MSCRGCIIDTLFDRGLHGNLGLYGYDAEFSHPHEMDFELLKCTEDCGCQFMDSDTKRLLRMSAFTAVFPDGRHEYCNIFGESNHFQKDGQLTLRGMAAIQVRQNLIYWLNRQKLTRYHFWDFLMAQIELVPLGIPFNLSKWLLPGLYYPQFLQIQISEGFRVEKFIVFGEIRFANRPFHGFRPELFLPGLFHHHLEVWTFLWKLLSPKTITLYPGDRATDLWLKLTEMLYEPLLALERIV